MTSGGGLDVSQVHAQAIPVPAASRRVTPWRPSTAVRLVIASMALVAALAVLASPLLTWASHGYGSAAESIRGIDLPGSDVYEGDDPFVGTIDGDHPDWRVYGPGTAIALGVLLAVAGAAAVWQAGTGSRAWCTGVMTAGAGVAIWSSLIAVNAWASVATLGDWPFSPGILLWFAASAVAAASLGLSAIISTSGRPVPRWWWWAPVAALVGPGAFVLEALLQRVDADDAYWLTLWAPIAVSSVATWIVVVGVVKDRTLAVATGVRTGPEHPGRWVALALAPLVAPAVLLGISMVLAPFV